MIETQIWKDVKGFPGYEVSNFGRVRSFGEYLTGEFFEGYYRVELQSRWHGKKRVRIFIHRLVLETFIGPCPIGHIAHHKDNDSSNNKLDNLEWISYGDHQHIAYATGSRYSKGDFHSQAKLNSKDVLEIRRLAVQGISLPKIAEKYPVSYRHIHNIVNHKVWTHI